MTPKKIFHIAFILLIFMPTAYSQEAGSENDWINNMSKLIYSPKYFGPSAFPIPELRNGRVSESYEVEIRPQYHYYVGDQTTDVYLRMLLPLVRGKAGLEINFIPWEKYKLTAETQEERNAAERECPPYEKYSGDVVLTAFFQLLQDNEWIDAMIDFSIKTASGGRLCDARFTDAATYWFNLNIGRDLAGYSYDKYYLRLIASSGFYCWMTNSLTHRQNDAWAYGIGLTGGLDKVTVSTDISGFNGYNGNGDSPLIWRNNVKLEFNKNVISFRYNHGIRDYMYETYSIAYIRKF